MTPEVDPAQANSAGACPTISDALRLITIGNKSDLQRSRSASPRPINELLKAVVAQYDGDVDGAIRSLQRQHRNAAGFARAVIADILAPILIMRHENDFVETLAQDVERGGLPACAYALRALSLADRGLVSESRRALSISRSLLSEISDDFVSLRVIQRLARTSLTVGNYADAIELAVAGASLSIRLGAYRAAGANYSVAYNVHHAVTGQFDEARRFAGLWRENALKCDDSSFIQAAMIAEYEMAVQYAEEPRIADLERQINSLLLPQQYSERFAFAFSYAVVRGALAPGTMKSLLQVIFDATNLSTGQRSLCYAMLALAETATNEDESARQYVKQAISSLGRPRSKSFAHEKFFRRAARGTIAAACVLLGDEVRADRVLEASELNADAEIKKVATLVRSQAWMKFAPHLQGLARVFRSSSENRFATGNSFGLTVAEMGVLRLLDRGWTAGRIATETNRSINTIYVHTRAILSKLHATRAIEAVAIARSYGIVS